NFEADLRFHLFFALFHLRQHAVDLRLAHRDRFVLCSSKADHAGCVADEIPGAPDQLIAFVQQMHVDDEIAGKKFSCRLTLFSFLDFRDTLSRNEHIVNQIAHFLCLDAFQIILAHLVFLPGKHVYNEPLIFACECLSHKSVYSSEKVHNVHQNEIKQRDVTAKQEHRDNDHNGRITQFLVTAESFLLWVPRPGTFLQLEFYFAEEVFDFGNHLKSNRDSLKR